MFIDPELEKCRCKLDFEYFAKEYLEYKFTKLTKDLFYNLSYGINYTKSFTTAEYNEVVDFYACYLLHFSLFNQSNILVRYKQIFIKYIKSGDFDKILMDKYNIFSANLLDKSLNLLKIKKNYFHDMFKNNSKIYESMDATTKKDFEYRLKFPIVDYKNQYTNELVFSNGSSIRIVEKIYKDMFLERSFDKIWEANMAGDVLSEEKYRELLRKNREYNLLVSYIEDWRKDNMMIRWS